MAEAHPVVEGHPVAVTDATYGQEVEQHRGLAVVDFWAQWCGPCHMVAPILEQLAGEYRGKLKVAKMDGRRVARVRVTVLDGIEETAEDVS